MQFIKDIINNGFSAELLVRLCAKIFVVFCMLPVHEFAHGYTAYRLGDNTAKKHGRLTLNPLAHIDPIGALMIFFIGFGYAKPVPVNIGNFKRDKRKIYMAITAFAGPLSNILMAIIFTFICQAILFTEVYENTLPYYICVFLQYTAIINIALAVFNMIPIPPYDGSRIISAVLPDKYYYTLMKYERYTSLIVVVLFFSGILDNFISAVSLPIYYAIAELVSFPFRFL